MKMAEILRIKQGVSDDAVWNVVTTPGVVYRGQLVLLALDAEAFVLQGTTRSKKTVVAAEHVVVMFVD